MRVTFGAEKINALQPPSRVGKTHDFFGSDVTTALSSMAVWDEDMFFLLMTDQFVHELRPVHRTDGEVEHYVIPQFDPQYKYQLLIIGQPTSRLPWPVLASNNKTNLSATSYNPEICICFILTINAYCASETQQLQVEHRAEHIIRDIYGRILTFAHHNASCSVVPLFKIK